MTQACHTHYLHRSFLEGVKVYFEGEEVGSYIADIVVEDSIILELKSQDAITNANRAQTLNYLKATGYKLAIILNFGKTRLQSERLTN
jgi:GxxExxY protein